MDATTEQLVLATKEASREESTSCAPSPTASSSPAVLLLIVVNVAVFLVLPLLAKDYPHNPIRMGALTRHLAFSGEWWRFITAEFVHVQLFHLLGNMAVLWILGKRMERLLGSLGVLTFYLGCGLIGDVAVLRLYPDSISLGASLPIAGLAGALLVVYGVRFSTLSKVAKWKFGLLLLFATGLVKREVFDTHYLVHTIGLLIGMISAAVFALITTRRSHSTISER